MNLYVRYFQRETLVSSLDEVRDFLLNTGEIQVDQAMMAEIAEYVADEKSYPLRYKLRPKVYFIIIKTEVSTLEEFKANNGKKKEAVDQLPTLSRKEQRAMALRKEAFGWYEGSLVFKRVVPITVTGKFQYSDTRFSALVKCKSGQECYDRIVEHLTERQDVDLRSQFPSAKGGQFTFQYHGEQLPSDICLVEEE